MCDGYMCSRGEAQSEDCNANQLTLLCTGDQVPREVGAGGSQLPCGDRTPGARRRAGGGHPGRLQIS